MSIFRPCAAKNPIGILYSNLDFIVWFPGINNKLLKLMRIQIYLLDLVPASRYKSPIPERMMRGRLDITPPNIDLVLITSSSQNTVKVVKPDI